MKRQSRSLLIMCCGISMAITSTIVAALIHGEPILLGTGLFLAALGFIESAPPEKD